MGWLGKLWGGGIGFFLGGPLGAVLGAVVGHMVGDREQSQDGNLNYSNASNEEIQLAYFTALFSLLAKVASADGHISRGEGDHLLRYLDNLNLDKEQRSLAIDIFNTAKDQGASAAQFAAQFYLFQRRQPRVLRNHFEDCVQMAAVDGFNIAKKRVLDSIAQEFHLDPFVVLWVYSRYGFVGGQQTNSFTNRQHFNPYQVLGLSPQASNDEIRRAYRKMVRETHPDILVSKGVPPELRQNAEKRFKEVQQAWEQIREERNFS